MDNMECPLENFLLVSATYGTLTHIFKKKKKKEASKLMKPEWLTT